MNKYKMYGIGNALLDYEYKVSDEVLKDLGLDKGCILLNAVSYTHLTLPTILLV